MAQRVSSLAFRVPSSLGVASALFVACLAGCHKPDEVRRYQVPRVEGRSSVLEIPSYTAPKGWKEKGRARGTVARFKETFEIGAGAGKAEVTVTAFDHKLGTLLANINRWRKLDVKIDELTELPKDVGKITVAKTEADYVDIAGPEKRVLGVMFEYDDYHWVVKMLGPKELVGEQKTEFEAFVRSVSFPEGPGQ